MGNIAYFQSGYPLTPGIGGNPSGSGLPFDVGADRPDIVTSENLEYARSINPDAVVYDPNTVITGNHDQWFNPNMFIPQEPGHLGTAGRGILRGGGAVNWDLSLNKDTSLPFLGESGKLQFRAEFFNVLNHPNMQYPSTTVWLDGSTMNPNAGENFSATAARQIQFALKLIF
jgi:hypothetical protein